MLRPHTVLAALALALPAVGVRAGEDPAIQEPPFTLAIVRRDSVLVPFASWTGKAWTNTWPVPRKQAETPITLDALPKRWWGKPGPVTAWHAWTRDGARHTLRPSTPTWFLAHCEQGTGLRSTYKTASPPPPPIVQPYPKDGVAASADVKFHPIAVLSDVSPVWKALGNALPAPLALEEDRLVKTYARTGWRHPRQEGRETVPIAIEAIYRVPVGTGGQFLYYFEAVKRYAPSADASAPKDGRKRDATCEVVTFVSGWFRAGNSDAVVTLSKLRPIMTSCDYAAADVMLPIAYIMWKGTPLWIVQFSGWGREWYTLLHAQTEPEPVMALETSGGSCPTIGG